MGSTYEEKAGMPFAEKLRYTVFPEPEPPTHVLINGAPCAVPDMKRLLGFSYEQWQMRQTVAAQRTFCSIGGAALTLDEFIELHPHIELGYD